MDDADAADVRSHGGPGASTFLLPSVEGVMPMPDKHFDVAIRDRLLLPVCQEGTRCKHRRSAASGGGFAMPCLMDVDTMRVNVV